MRFTCRFFVILACLLLFPLYASAAGVSLKDGALVIGGEKMETAEVGKVDNAELWFAALGNDDAEKANARPGLYIFDASGERLYRLDVEYPEVVYGASLSPGGGRIAIVGENGGNAALDIRELASGKELVKIDYCYVVAGGPGFLWVNDNTLVLSAGDFEKQDWYEIRKCEYDPCMAVSVEKYDIVKGSSETLFEGTGTCDYVLVGLKDGVAQVEKRCKASPGDWKEAWDDDRRPEILARKVAD